MTSDARKAFDFLKDNISQWIVDLDTLRARVNEKNAEANIARAATLEVPKNRTGSVTLIRSTDQQVPSPGATEGLFSLGATQATIGLPTQAAESSAARKRKPASALSGRASGPQRYRNRNNNIIYYDSEIQNAFELLVRNIATGRNMLRKGKMAAKIEAMTETNSNDSESSGDSSSDNSDMLISSNKIGYRPKHGLPHFSTSRSMARTGGALDGLRAIEASSDIFDTTDKALEKAQNLCERGAHQQLRDGDCRAEVHGCLEFFQEASTLALAEAERYRIKEEKALARRSRQEAAAVAAQAEIEAKRTSFHNTSHEIDLEVDDSEEELDEIDIAALRPPPRLSRRV